MRDSAMQWLVFSDLDGTLLDERTYSWAAARSGLELLAGRSVPLVLVTSKTLAEVEPLRRDMQLGDPFIVENGAAVFLPPGDEWPEAADLAGDGRIPLPVVRPGICGRAVYDRRRILASAVFGDMIIDGDLGQNGAWPTRRAGRRNGCSPSRARRSRPGSPTWRLPRPCRIQGSGGVAGSSYPVRRARTVDGRGTVALIAAYQRRWPASVIRRWHRGQPERPGFSLGCGHPRSWSSVRRRPLGPMVCSTCGRTNRPWVEGRFHHLLRTTLFFHVDAAAGPSAALQEHAMSDFLSERDHHSAHSG